MNSSSPFMSTQSEHETFQLPSSSTLNMHDSLKIEFKFVSKTHKSNTKEKNCYFEGFSVATGKNERFLWRRERKLHAEERRGWRWLGWKVCWTGESQPENATWWRLMFDSGFLVISPSRNYCFKELLIDCILILKYSATIWCHTLELCELASGIVRKARHWKSW